MTRDEAEKIVLDAARDFACQCFWRFTSERRDPILLAATMMEQKTPEGVPEKLFAMDFLRCDDCEMFSIDDSPYDGINHVYRYVGTVTLNQDGSVSE